MKAMRLIVDNGDDYSPEMKNCWNNAVKRFLDALAAFKATKRPQVWIAVVKRKGEVKTFAEYAVRIEMRTTVTTSPGIPFTTCMGIFKGHLRG